MKQIEVAGVTLNIREPEDWQNPAEPISSSLPFIPGDITHGVIHWPGASNSWIPPTTDNEIIEHLRDEQHWYLTDEDHGFSIGYGFEISQTRFPDNIWGIRQFDFRNAANNGDKPPFNSDNFNKFSIAIQFHASVAKPVTPDQLMAGRYLIKLADQVCGRTLIIQGHQVSDFTTCPGDVLMKAIPALSIRPVENPQPLPSRKVKRHVFICKFKGAYYIGDEVWTKIYGPKVATSIINRHEKIEDPLRNFKFPRQFVLELNDVAEVDTLRGVGKPVNTVAEEE